MNNIFNFAATSHHRQMTIFGAAVRLFFPIFLLFNLHFAQSQLTAQTFTCNVGGESGMPPAPCPEADFTPEEIQDLPIVTIWVNVHFVGHPVFGNFYPGLPDDWARTNGNKWAELMLNHANERMADIPISPTSLANFTGDSKFRYKLYTESGNSNDQHGGVWYWPSYQQLQLPYGSKALNIIVWAQNTPSNPAFGGSTCGTTWCSSITMSDAYYHASIPDPNDPVVWGWWAYAGILNHEFGHMAGLCHAFYCQNPCNGIDLNVQAECNQNNNCYNDCGSSPSGVCNPWTSGSTNMMGYNGAQMALTPCQWQTMMKRAVYHTPQYIDFCDAPIQPLVIAAETEVTWDKIKILNRDVVIEPLAQLTINCEARLAEGRTISVKRGARLKVEGGKLTNLCKGKKWRGVLVYGNNDVSHVPGMQNGPLVEDNPGIVVLNNAEVLNASNAISCNPPVGWPDLTKNWNGIIVATGTKFRNNTRSAEFMLDDQVVFNPDGSYSILGENLNISAFTTCEFLNEDGTASQGVTDWGTSNISFTGCLFKNLSSMGLQTWDAGVTVTKSMFTGNYFGIHATATADLSSQLVIGGETDALGNTFTSNYDAIYSTTIQDMVVSHNKFYSNQVGHYAFGQSEYDVNNNLFSGGVAGIANLQTNNGWKRAYCNLYSSPQLGISNQGNNVGFRFDHEEFSTQFNVYVTDYSTPGNDPGRLPAQGSFNAAAWNYFNEFSNRNIVTFGNTIPFFYFYPAGEGVPTRTKPKCSLNDQVGVGGLTCTSTNNFYSISTSGGDVGCLAFKPGEEPNISKNSLNLIRSDIATVKAQLQQGGGDAVALEGDLARLADRKDYVVNRLTKSWLSTGNFPEVETLYQEEGDTRKLVGLKIRQGQWSAAEQLLNAMPSNTLGDTYFKQTQQINLKRLKAPFPYALNVADQTTLETVSTSKTDAAPYAQALLNMLTGVVFQPQIPVVPEDRSQPQDTPTSDGLLVSPNPTTGAVTLQIPPNGLSESAQVQVSGLTGLVVRTIVVANSPQVSFSMEDLPNGIYLISLTDRGRSISQAKLVVQH